LLDCRQKRLIEDLDVSRLWTGLARASVSTSLNSEELTKEISRLATFL
jgi:hypothetical protein